jgi:hypothetical protein
MYSYFYMVKSTHTVCYDLTHAYAHLHPQTSFPFHAHFIQPLFNQVSVVEIKNLFFQRDLEHTHSPSLCISFLYCQWMSLSCQVILWVTNGSHCRSVVAWPCVLLIGLQIMWRRSIEYPAFSHYPPACYYAVLFSFFQYGCVSIHDLP